MKMTVNQILEQLNAIRSHTCPPNEGPAKTRGIDQIVEADRLLLDLQERLLNDYGSDPQSTQPQT